MESLFFQNVLWNLFSAVKGANGKVLTDTLLFSH